MKNKWRRDYSHMPSSTRYAADHSESHKFRRTSTHHQQRPTQTNALMMMIYLARTLSDSVIGIVLFDCVNGKVVSDFE